MLDTDTVDAIDPSPLIDGSVGEADTANVAIDDDVTLLSRRKVNDDGNDNTDGGASSSQPPPPSRNNPLASTRRYFSELSRHFPWRFLSWLAIYQSCISGGSYSLVKVMPPPSSRSWG